MNKTERPEDWRSFDDELLAAYKHQWWPEIGEVLVHNYTLYGAFKAIKCR